MPQYDPGVDGGYDDDYRDRDRDDELSPLSALLTSGLSTVTPEGKAQASKLFGELYAKRGQYDTEEQTAYDDYEKRAQEAREVLRMARDRLSAQKVPTTKWLEMAAGFGAPTRAGSFGESVS